MATVVIPGAGPVAHGPERRHHPAAVLRWTQIGVLFSVGAAAVYGGLGLMISGLGMPDEWLERTPFDTWLLPGVALLLLVAAPQLGAAAALVIDRGRADRAGILAGLVLMGWIVVQVALLQRFFFLQPVIFAFGALEVALAWWRSARRRVDDTMP